MNDQTYILQQGVQVISIHSSRQQAIKWIGGEQHKQQEANRNQTHHTQHPRHHFIRQMLAKAGDSYRPQGQDKCPQ